VQGLLDWMEKNRMDFTNTFRMLGDLSGPAFPDAEFLEWHERWTARLARQPQAPDEVSEFMFSNNPSAIPRNHKVEEALAAASDHGDLSVMERLLVALENPYAVDPPSEFTSPAPPGGQPYQTFCGT
jgi:uncharacterized protein YdiU (UPF0061 family)